MGIYILQGSTLILPYKISQFADDPETYNQYLDDVNLYDRIRVLILESNELSELPSNILRFHSLERLELRGAYWVHLTGAHIPPSVQYLNLSGVRNLNIDFFDCLSNLTGLRSIEILEGHLTLLPDWETSSIESIAIHLENYNNFLMIRNTPANSLDLWKLIPAMRINKDACYIIFEPHYDQSYLGVVVINRDLRKE